MVKRVSAYIDDEMYEQLRLMAFKGNISQSEAIKQAIKDYLDDMTTVIRDNLHRCREVGYYEYGFTWKEIDECNKDGCDLGCKPCPARDEQRNFIEGWLTK